MEKGKNICNQLREVRKAVADAHGIDYTPTPCTHTGFCKGTCPKCESEVRYLENELKLRQQAGKVVKIVGLATSLVALSACNGSSTANENRDSTTIIIEDTLEEYAPTTGFTDSVPPPLPPPPPYDAINFYLYPWNNIMGEINEYDENYEDSSRISIIEPCSDLSTEELKKEREKIKNSNEIQWKFDKNPDYKGGFKQLHKEVYASIEANTTVKALKDKMKKDAVLVVIFNIEKDGTLTNIEVSKSNHPAFNKIATEALSATSGNWIPAQLYGIPVRMRFKVPIVVKTPTK